MKGDADENQPIFSYVTPAQRIPKDHPLRTVRDLVDAALKRLAARGESPAHGAGGEKDERRGQAAGVAEDQAAGLGEHTESLHGLLEGLKEGRKGRQEGPATSLED